MTRLDDRFVYLKISTYIGVSLGAQHYYGELVCKDKRVQMKFKMSAAQAARLNKAHDWKGYKAGRLSENFESKDDLIALAKATYKDYFPDAIMLVLGNPVYAEPQLCLDGDRDLMEKINHMAKELKAEEEKAGGSNYETPKMAEINDTYWALVGETEERDA